VLHEGPVPAGLDRAALRRARAEYLESAGLADRRRAEEAMAMRDAALAAAGTIVLWFEHDLYDQLQLIEILALLGERPSPTGVSMICVGTFPGRPHFAGLGELTPAEVATLWPSRTPVAAEQVDLGRRAWAAFRSDDPTSIERLLADGTDALPYLEAALGRLLEQYPWTGDGLSRTERALLRALAARGEATAAALFAAAADEEQAPFLGDTIAWAMLAELTRGPVPLVVRADDGPHDPADPAFADVPFALTADGGRVLAGAADRVELRGIDRWIGGVHLRGRDVPRYDARAGRVLPAGGPV
jgi:hypothetical protein